MLSKRRRLRAAEVKEVLEKGRSLSSGLLSMKYMAKGETFRTAAVVPKSLARLATERNRLRRALYRAISSASLPQKGYCAVFFVRGVPKTPLTPAFLLDISHILQKTL